MYVLLFLFKVYTSLISPLFFSSRKIIVSIIDSSNKYFISLFKYNSFKFFPWTVNIPFTPFEDVTKIVTELEDQGVENFVVKYDGWINGGLFGKYPSKQ